jgi:hypothetical protein
VKERMTKRTKRLSDSENSDDTTDDRDAREENASEQQMRVGTGEADESTLRDVIMLDSCVDSDGEGEDFKRVVCAVKVNERKKNDDFGKLTSRRGLRRLPLFG